MVKSANPKAVDAVKPAPKGPKPGDTASAKEDPYVFWDKYFAATKFKPGEAEKFLFQTVTELIKVKKFDLAEAAIKRFLSHHGKEAEPWMYVFLAECIKVREGGDAFIKQALGFAGHLAKRNKNPDDLVRVADMLVLRGFYGPVGDPGYQTNIGELVDLASDQVPTNAWPIMMSVNLATHEHDPKRMADAAERLLSIGWPGYDDRVRRDLKEQVKNLADVLKGEGRSEEAEALMTKLAISESRDIYMKLSWKGEADIDMSVAEPFGSTANYQNFRTVSGGAIIQNGYGKHPEEVYVAPRAFGGDYVVTFEKIVDYDEKKPVLEATLQVILHEGSPDEKIETYRINLAKPEPIVVKLPKEGERRKKFLPFVAAPAAPGQAGPPPANPAGPNGAANKGATPPAQPTGNR